LRLNGGNDARMLVAEVGEHQLRAEVEVAPTVGVDQVATRTSNEGRDIARPLHHPGMKNEFVEIHDILRFAKISRRLQLRPAGGVSGPDGLLYRHLLATASA
jgi:hypothetical protein